MTPLTIEETGRRRIEDITNEGKIAVQYCGGQTTLWIPREYCQKLGASQLLSYVEQIFTYEAIRKSVGDVRKDLEEWILSVEVPELSAYEIELPSVTRLREGELPIIDPEEKISKLIRLINRGLTK